MMLNKLAHTVVALIFMAMALVQLNDPDPIYWVAVYIAIASVPASRIFGLRSTLIQDVAFGMCLAGLLISASGFFDYLTSQDYASIGGAMLEGKPYIESAREFLGLLIGIICLTLYRVDRLKL